MLADPLADECGFLDGSRAVVVFRFLADASVAGGSLVASACTTEINTNGDSVVSVLTSTVPNPTAGQWTCLG